MEYIIELTFKESESPRYVGIDTPVVDEKHLAATFPDRNAAFKHLEKLEIKYPLTPEQEAAFKETPEAELRVVEYETLDPIRGK